MNHSMTAPADTYTIKETLKATITLLFLLEVKQDIRLYGTKG